MYLNDGMKRKIFRSILVISIATIVVLFNSCSKEARLKEEIIGTWISIDNIDTLDFISDEIFLKNFSWSMERYSYDINRDNITINYSGSLYILTLPTTHHIEIEDNTMSIDFSNGSYGMRKQEILFERIK
jgi:hypothetical protein